MGPRWAEPRGCMGPRLCVVGTMITFGKLGCYIAVLENVPLLRTNRCQKISQHPWFAAMHR